MKLNYVILYVDDVGKATEFYQSAFGIPLSFIHESNMYAEMNTGETILAFAHHDMMKMNINVEATLGMKTSFEIAFSTDDVKGAFARAIQSGAKELKGPEQKPWGQIVAYVQDNFGTIVEICSPMS